MSLVLLQSFVSEITANEAKMAQNKKDIDDIKSQLIFMNEYIKELKDFDELQVAADAEAAVIIAGIQAEILALKAANNVQDDGEKIINQEVDNLQEDVKVLQDNDKKEEADKAAMLAAEIATLEAQLLELTMALNPVKPATHPELFLGDSGVPADADVVPLEIE